MDIKKTNLVMAIILMFLMILSVVSVAYADPSLISYDDFDLELEGGTIYAGENMTLTGTFVSHINSKNNRFPENPNVRVLYQVVNTEYLESNGDEKISGSIPSKTVGEAFTNVEDGIEKNVEYTVVFEDVVPRYKQASCGDEVYIIYRFYTHNDAGRGEQVYQFQRYGEDNDYFTGSVGPYEYSCKEKETFIVGETFSSIKQWFIDLLNRLIEVVQNA